jgi:glyoxylase-like metal-dependent hydrolase (beta-lactamase superfamily II)
MIDAGTGIATLVERPDLLDGLDRLDILLTHFRLDHVAGLAVLPRLVWALGPPSGDRASSCTDCPRSMCSTG